MHLYSVFMVCYLGPTPLYSPFYTFIFISSDVIRRGVGCMKTLFLDVDT